MSGCTLHSLATTNGTMPWGNVACLNTQLHQVRYHSSRSSCSQPLSSTGESIDTTGMRRCYVRDSKDLQVQTGLWHHLIWLQPAQYIVDPATRAIVLRLQYLHDGNTKTDTLETNRGRCWCKQNRAKEKMKPHSNHGQDVSHTIIHFCSSMNNHIIKGKNKPSS